MYRLDQKICSRLCDLSTAPAGGISQPRTNFFGQLCTVQQRLLKKNIVEGIINSQFSPDLASLPFNKPLEGTESMLSFTPVIELCFLPLSHIMALSHSVPDPSTVFISSACRLTFHNVGRPLLLTQLVTPNRTIGQWLS